VPNSGFVFSKLLIDNTGWMKNSAHRYPIRPICVACSRTILSDESTWLMPASLRTAGYSATTASSMAIFLSSSHLGNLVANVVAPQISVCSPFTTVFSVECSTLRGQRKARPANGKNPRWFVQASLIVNGNERTPHAHHRLQPTAPTPRGPPTAHRDQGP
jgi:hypothetical protein